MAKYPYSDQQVRLHSRRLFERMGHDRHAVYARFVKRAGAYGCVRAPRDNPKQNCAIYVKSGTALLMYPGGIPVIRGQGGTTPNSDIANELCRMLSDAATRSGFPPG